MQYKRVQKKVGILIFKNQALQFYTMYNNYNNTVLNSTKYKLSYVVPQ